MKYTQEQIIELAKEVEANDGIEWGNLPLDRDKIYQVVGSQAYELFDQFSATDDSEAVLMATVIKLLVENFVLNLQLSKIDL